MDTRTNEPLPAGVLFLAYTGTRFAEMSALRVSTFRTAFGAAPRAIGGPGPHPHEVPHRDKAMDRARAADHRRRNTLAALPRGPGPIRLEMPKRP